MTKFTEMLHEGKEVEIHLIQGTGENGRQIYSFIAMESDMAQKFKVENIAKTCNASEYGAVLHTGVGIPSDFVKQAIIDKFASGADE